MSNHDSRIIQQSNHIHANISSIGIFQQAAPSHQTSTRRLVHGYNVQTLFDWYSLIVYSAWVAWQLLQSPWQLPFGTVE